MIQRVVSPVYITNNNRCCSQIMIGNTKIPGRDSWLPGKTDIFSLTIVSCVSANVAKKPAYQGMGSELKMQVYNFPGIHPLSG
jgi:hypothetical protein